MIMAFDYTTPKSNTTLSNSELFMNEILVKAIVVNCD